MAAISSLQAREVAHQFAKRSNWAGKEAGVIVVFCVVFVIVVGLGGLFISRAISRRKAARPSS